MANSLKLTDNNYWGSDRIAVMRGTECFPLDNVRFDLEVQGGMINVGSSVVNGAYKVTNVTFPTAFSTKPIVIVSDARVPDVNGYAGCRFAVQSNSISTTGFKCSFFNSTTTGTKARLYFQYLAIAPRSTLSAANSVSKGTLVKPTTFASAFGSGNGLAMTDRNYWDLTSIYDHKSGTAHKTLHDTYYTFDSGKVSLECPTKSAQTNSTRQIVTMNKTFANIPIVIVSLASNESNTHGKISVSATPLDALPGSETANPPLATTFDAHKQFYLQVFNNSGATKNVTAN